MALQAVNAFLDELPRTRFAVAGRQVPAFRSCGIAGFYVALVVSFGGALVTGRSLLVMGATAAVCALSFYAYAYARRRLAGHERLVLLEHVWFAEACAAALLVALREPVLPYLDLVSVALCLFLAAGRVGCLLTGCCHGRPSLLGVRYDQRHVHDGFPRHLVGVRLFPVQAVEALALLLIGAGGAAGLRAAAPGGVLVWTLAAYAVVRFGLEGLRGDARPHWLGLSQSRWMALVEMGVASWLAPGAPRLSTSLGALAVLGATAVVAVVARRRGDRPRRALLRPEHVREVAALAAQSLERAPDVGSPVAHRTACGVSVAAAAVGGATAARAHVSLALPEPMRDPPLLCALAAAAFAEIAAADAVLTGTVLHVQTPLPLEDGVPPPASAARLADETYGALLRRWQEAQDQSASPSDEGDEGPRAPRRRSGQDGRGTYFSGGRAESSGGT